MLVSEPVEDRPISGKRAFLQHYGSTIFGQGLTLGLGILTGILSARMLGPVGRGEYAAIIVWPMGIANFLAFGINQAAVFHLGQRTFSTSQTATAVTVIGIVQSAISVAIGLVVVPLVLAKYSGTVQALGILFVLLTPVIILSGYPGNLFQGMQDLPRFNFIRVMAPLTYAAGLVGLYALHRGNLQSVIFSQLAGFILALTIGIALVWRILKPRLQWNSSAIPSLLHYGIRSHAGSIAYYFNQRIDQLILSLLVPPKQLGFYAVAVTLSTTVAVFPQAAGIVAFSRGSSQQAKDAKVTAGVAFRSSLLWLLAACGGLYALAPFLIRFVFGGAFDGSILACRILLPGALVAGLSFVLYNAASAMGRPGLGTVAEGVGVIATAMGLFLLVPRYGYIGAALVSSIAYTVSFLVMVVLSHRLLGLTMGVLLLGNVGSRRDGVDEA